MALCERFSPAHAQADEAKAESLPSGGPDFKKALVISRLDEGVY
jgi:hypothetical protein